MDCHSTSDFKMVRPDAPYGVARPLNTANAIRLLLLQFPDLDFAVLDGMAFGL